MKKLLALLLCLVLLPLCAFQEETHPLKEILDSAEKMLFQTERETLGISSEFYYDGEYFKTVNGEYVQDGADSLLDLKLSTVDYDGSVLKSGYRVMAKDGVAYSHSYGVWGYDVFTPEEDTTPLRYNSEYGSFFRLIHAVSPLLENLLPASFRTEDNGSTRTVALTLHDSDSPEALNEIMRYTIRLLAKKLMYFDADAIQTDTDWDWNHVESSDAYFEDWDALFRKVYRDTYQKPFPADFYEKMWEEDGGTLLNEYNEISEKTSGYYQRAIGEYDTGVVYIRADGSFDHYPDQVSYIKAQKLEYNEYEDYDAVFAAWYERKTGEKLDDAFLNALSYGNNDKLWEAYDDFCTQMQDDYLEKLRALSGAYGYVKADGTLEVIDDLAAFYKKQNLEMQTVAQKALLSMETLSFGDSAVSVVFDSEGRMTGAEGDVLLNLTNSEGEKHTVRFTFTCSASYSDCMIPEFDEPEWQWSETEDTAEDPAEETPQLPKSIIFDGVEYIMHPADNG